VISRADAPPALKMRAMRRWTIRHIARAVARGDVPLTRALAVAVQRPLAGDDLDLLAGSLRWALCQEHRVGPARATPEQQHEWLEKVRPALAEVPGAGGTLSRLGFATDRWAAAARGLLARIESGGTGVMYGVGRNGRELVAAIERVLAEDLSSAERLGLMRGHIPRLAWVDDDEAAQAPVVLGRSLPRLRADALSPRHVVLVTPDQAGGIVRRLRAGGVSRVESAESIAVRPAGGQVP
jgi:hypothetical protein